MERSFARRRIGCQVAAIGLTMALSGGAVAGDVSEIRFEAVTEFSTNFWYTDFQKPYFEETLPKLSSGKLTANAVPFDQLGLTGFEMMKLLKTGTYDFAAGTIGYVTGDSPAIEGIMLAGALRSTDDFKKVNERYFPIIAREFETKYNAKLVAMYTYPVSQLFCNFGDKSKTDITLASVKGTTIRSYATTVSDLIEGLGAKPVTLPFGEVATAMQRGTIQCVVSTTMAGYNTKFHQVSTHLFPFAANYTVGYYAFNLETWNSLTPEAQGIIETSLKDLANQMVDRTAKDEEDANACLTTGPCKYGEAGQLTVIKPSEADLAMIRDIVKNQVVPRWVQRCGTQQCLAEWNDAVGSVIGVTVQP